MEKLLIIGSRSGTNVDSVCGRHPETCMISCTLIILAVNRLIKAISDLIYLTFQDKRKLLQRLANLETT